MRLTTKTSLFYIAGTIIVFLFGGILFYNILDGLFYNQIDEGLLTEKSIIETEIEYDKDIADYATKFGHQISVTLFRHPVKNSINIHDTIINDSLPHAYRQLRASGTKKGKWGYIIEIMQPIPKISRIFHSTVEMFVIMFLCMMLILILVNFIISKQIWHPFYRTIRVINRYNITNSTVMEFSSTNISEFKKLNNVLTQMSEKILKDYYNQKEFAENASHEIQTPLAVIKSKVELLIQDENLSQKQIKTLQEISTSASKISKLNSWLLLLTKIDNNQYQNMQDIQLDVLIKNMIEEFDELIAHKQLSVELSIKNKPAIKMNPQLTEILLTNIINNSIRHNISGGFITICLEQDYLTITNSGEPLQPDIDTRELFNRFTKAKKQSDSLGLGLAIVKKICDYHKLYVEYIYQDKKHSIRIRF